MSTPDNSPLLDAAEAILACVCSALAASERPVCCCILVHAAGLPAADLCCACEPPGTATNPDNGFAWVKVAAYTPVYGTAPGARGRCIVGWTLTLDVGIYRCVTLGVDGNPPPLDAVQADALGLARDAEIIGRALACCPLDGCSNGNVVITPWRPTGPRGGMAGGVTQVQISL